MRRALPLVLIGLLAGCSAISDFDFTFDDEDAGPDAGSFDAGDVDGDAGPRRDADGLDAGADDAGPAVDRCPAPCVADAISDYSGSQGAGDVDWRYYEDRRQPLGAFYPEMSETTSPIAGFSGGANAFVASCADNPSLAECESIRDRLLVQGDAPGAGSDAVIGFEAGARATYRVQGTVRLPDGVSSAEAHRITLSRNSRHDVLGSVNVVPTTTPETFDALVDVLPGDRVLVTFEQRGGSEAVPLGVQLWVTRMGAPLDDRCVHGMRFEGANPLLDECSGETLEDLATEGTAGSSQGPSVSAFMGTARELVSGQYLRPTATPIDYSGDFTIQFWVNNSSSTPFECSLWADSTSDMPAGGITVIMNDDRVSARTFHADDGRTCPSSGRPGICLKFQTMGTITQDEWHFIRVTRATADNEILICIDGVQRGRLDVHGTLNLTPAYRPSIGRNVDFNPAYFVGSFDDVRIFDVALPCTR